MRALVLSGGGAKGAAEVGVLDYLLEKEPKLDYDIYAGVSVGALNISLLASGPLKETLPKLKEIWFNQVKGNSSVWRHNLWYSILGCIILISCLFILSLVSFMISAPKIITLGIFILAFAAFYFPYRALNNSHSVYKNDPLKKLVTSNLDINKLKNSGKQIAIGAVSFNSGNYKSIRHVDDKIIDWIMASSAFPVFFPMSFIDGEYWTDGGVVNIAPLSDALEMGATEIDVVITSPLNAGYFYGNAALIKQIMRNIDIMSATVLQGDVIYNDLLKNNIKIRFFVIEKQLTSNSLNFAPDKIQNMFQEGRKLAEKILSS